MSIYKQNIEDKRIYAKVYMWAETDTWNEMKWNELRCEPGQECTVRRSLKRRIYENDGGGRQRQLCSALQSIWMKNALVSQFW